MPRPHPLLKSICERLLVNVRRRLPDQAATMLSVPAQVYRDPDQWQREIDSIFLRMPLLVALSCEVRQPGDYVALQIAGRPIVVVRGDDGRVRAFLNLCRHRGARVASGDSGYVRRFICPYHAWTYDRAGRLVGMTETESFGEHEVTGLLELPSEERAGMVFACLSVDATLDLVTWLGDMLPSLEALELDRLYPFRPTTTLASPNWKIAADGYLDGYHIGYLHKDSIGRKAITNRNTYDLFGPHVRIGFANRRIEDIETRPDEEWVLADYMSLVHFVFPNISISGGQGDALMLSRLLPGPTVDRSTTVQHQYFREPVAGEAVAIAEARRLNYEQVVRDEDYATTFGISAALPAMDGSPVLFGRNEPGNQNLHRHIAQMTGSNLY